MGAAVTIVNVGYRSTNYWVVSAGRARVLIDLGWPGTMGLLRANLARLDVPLSEIRYAIATHFHPDHAGLAQPLKDAGVPLLLADVQVAWAPTLATIVKSGDGYIDLRMDDNVVVTCDQSRATLAAVGLHGQLVHTPGHSADSISLLLDTGEVFTGDLTPPALAVADDATTVAASWARLRALGARLVYPGHGRPGPLPSRPTD